MDRHATPGERRFVTAVARALGKRCGVGRGQRVLVAVSGGADSVALLTSIAELARQPRWRLQLAVGHVHHHLRNDPSARGGPGDAELDADLVAKLAGTLELPFMRADLDLEQAGGNLEAEARRQRYAALAQMAGQFHAPFVATAHHADDQLETVLMRLLRGAAVGGMAAMAWRRLLAGVLVVRPMLAVNRAAVRQFLKQRGINWREDRTNRDTTRLRNRLRHGVVPLLHQIDPKAGHRAVRLADHLRQVDRFLDQSAAEAHGRLACGDRTLDRAGAGALPQVVLKTLLRALLADAGARADKLGHRALEPLAVAIRDGRGDRRQFTYSGQVVVEVDRDHVQVQRQVKRPAAACCHPPWPDRTVRHRRGPLDGESVHPFGSAGGAEHNGAATDPDAEVAP